MKFVFGSCLSAFSLVLLSGLSPISANAESVTDLAFQQVIERYFDYPTNARTFGMAGSSVQTATDSGSIVGNPAGIGLMQGGEFSASYGHNNISGKEFPTGQSVNQRTNSGSSMIALPLGPVANGLPAFGNFGLAWSGADSKWINDSFDTESNRTAVTADYALAVTEALSLGYSLGWTADHFQSHAIFDYPMGDGFRHTVGAVWKADSGLTFGASGFVGHGEHHALYGPGITGNTSTTQAGLDLGAEYKLEQTTFALGLDYRHLNSNGDVIRSIPANFVGGDENGNVFNIRLGAEHAVSENAVLRAGYRYAGLSSYKYNRVELNDLNGSANYSAWTLGLGYVFPVTSTYIKSVNLDYGVEYRAVGDDDWQHLVTVSVPFGLCS